MKRVAMLALLLAVGCEGPRGPRGLPGRDVPAADAEPAGVDSGLELDAEPAEPLDGGSEDAEDATPTGALSGVVRDRLGVVKQGAIVLIAKQRVVELAGQPLDLTQPAAALARASNDEPLEDALKAGQGTLRAAVSSDGSFSFDEVPDGEYFVLFTPAEDDPYHLPGGQLARSPFAADALRGAVLEIQVSGTPSSSARFVGSESCLNCHGRHGVFASAHSLTLRVPGLSTPQQDTAGAPRIDEALAAFSQGTTLYFACQPGGVSDATCAVTTAPPTAPSELRLTIRLGRDDTVPEGLPGHYFAELAAGTTPARRLPIALSLGGTRSLQQYIARVPLPAGGASHFLLPVSYQLAGDDAHPSFSDHRWAAYRIGDWLDPNTGAVQTPANARAFERECAGCHSTGFSLRGDEARGFTASAVASAQGSYDLNGDGRKELWAVGCEACHGPGSEHIERVPRGQRIVSPSLLTPERSNMLCGFCHGRYQGKHGEAAPLDDGLSMPRAGISRSDFLARHVSRIEADADAVFATGDSRLGNAQYADFLRSPKYRSGELLVTCSECHDAHRTQGFTNDLKDRDGEQSCRSCHAGQRDVMQHIADEIRFPHTVGVAREQFTCTICHMVKTARAAARLPTLRDVTDPDPGRHQTYYHGDRTSHRFVFTDRSQAAEQPVAITQGCAPCHGELLPSP